MRKKIRSRKSFPKITIEGFKDNSLLQTRKDTRRPGFIAPINDGDNNVILDQWIGNHITH